MDYIDYYHTLGVERTASQADIKRAYRKLARQYHPDLHPNDPAAQAKFQQLNEANEVLGDPEKRRKYDEYGEHWQHAEEIERQRRASQGNPMDNAYEGFYTDFVGGTDNGFEGFEQGSGRFSSFFEQLFGTQGQRRQQYMRGQDLEAELQLTLREAATTHHRIIQVAGRKLRITLPAGITDGQRIKLNGKGGKGINGGTDGDLYLTLHITPDTDFERHGDDLTTTAHIDLYTALLGGETTIDTLTGRVKLKIKPLTQNLSKVRLKGKGFPLYKQPGKAGDLIVNFLVDLPSSLTTHQQELLKQMKAESDTAHRPPS